MKNVLCTGNQLEVVFCFFWNGLFNLPENLLSGYRPDILLNDLCVKITLLKKLLWSKKLLKLQLSFLWTRSLSPSFPNLFLTLFIHSFSLSLALSHKHIHSLILLQTETYILCLLRISVCCMYILSRITLSLFTSFLKNCSCTLTCDGHWILPLLDFKFKFLFVHLLSVIEEVSLLKATKFRVKVLSSKEIKIFCQEARKTFVILSLASLSFCPLRSASWAAERSTNDIPGGMRKTFFQYFQHPSLVYSQKWADNCSW